MSRWFFLNKECAWLSRVGVFLCLFLFVNRSLAAEPPPNIVFILTDDLGINDLSCYGRKDQPSPHLDRLAEQGMRFTQAYCAQPICSPTRAALLTGKSPARLHLTTFLPGRPDAPSQLLLHPTIEQQLPLAEQTIAELLKPAGYVSGCLGKWHLGGPKFGPKMQGFDEAMPGKPVSVPSETEGGKGEYFLTALAEDFLERHQNRPFFLFLSHDTPHVALAAKPALIEKHAKAWNPTYAAMIETLDECVGRVLAKLDALGLSERTIVVFTSDNGGLHVPELPLTPATHNTPFRAGKGFLYEGGLRVPLIVRWPGKVPSGSVENYPVITTDWLPTLLEAATVTPPANLDGISLLGLLTRKASPPARNLFWHFPHYTNQGGRPGGAVRSGDWKLIEHTEDGRAELFDLAQDAGETNDVAMSQSGKVAELRGKLAAWRVSVGAQENQPNPAFARAQWEQLYRNVDVSQVEPGATYLEPRAPALKLARWNECCLKTGSQCAAPGGHPTSGKSRHRAWREAALRAAAGEKHPRFLGEPGGLGRLEIHRDDAGKV